MHTDTPPKEKSTGDGNPDPADSDKTFAELQATYSLKVHRAGRSDDRAPYWAERCGLAKYLPTIDAARRFLDVIGGRL